MLEKYSTGDEEHCAFHAMLISTLVLILNAIVLFFTLTTFLKVDLDDSVMGIGTLIVLFIVFIVAYKWLYHSRKYVSNNSEIEGSKYKGSRGNWIIGIYLGITFASMVLLALYFIYFHTT